MFTLRPIERGSGSEDERAAQLADLKFFAPRLRQRARDRVDAEIDRVARLNSEDRLKVASRPVKEPSIYAGMFKRFVEDERKKHDPSVFKRVVASVSSWWA